MLCKGLGGPQEKMKLDSHWSGREKERGQRRAVCQLTEWARAA